MMRSLWYRRLRRLFSSRPAQAMPPRRERTLIRPRLEGLEDRTLLSANTYLVNLAGDAGTSP